MGVVRLPFSIPEPGEFSFPDAVIVCGIFKKEFPYVKNNDCNCARVEHVQQIYCLLYQVTGHMDILICRT